MNRASLNDFFQPRGVALIGASAKAGSPSNQILKYSKEMSLTGKVFPVNPSQKEIEGLKSFSSILEIPDPIDLIIMAVGSKNALKVAHDVRTRRMSHGDAGAVAIVSAGFKEMGTPEAIALQDEMIDIMTSCGARVIGPNCQGVVDLHNGVNTTFSVPPVTLKGGLSIVSQSGAFATSFLRWSKDQNMVAMNKFITLGNMADVEVTEIIRYLAEDEKTTSIAMYLEGTPNARALIEASAEVAKKKPLTVIKAGRSEMGSSVAMSHTASVAGSDAIYDGAFKQAGVIRTTAINEFYHTARVFDKMPVPKGNRICILTVVGGPSTISVDAMVDAGGVEFAHLSDELKENLRAVLSPSANVGSPDGYIDMTASVTNSMHTDCIRYLMEDDNIDAILFITSPPGFMDETELAEAVMEGYRSVDESKRKPLFTVLMAGNAVSTCRNILEENNFPTFDFPDVAVKVLANMIKYGAYRSRTEE